MKTHQGFRVPPKRVKIKESTEEKIKERKTKSFSSGDHLSFGDFALVYTSKASPYRLCCSFICPRDVLKYCVDP
jgi:hypothetical protein